MTPKPPARPVTLLSAKAGTGLDPLLTVIDERLRASRETSSSAFLMGWRALAWLHRHGDVLEQTDDGEGLRVKVALRPDERARLDQRLGQGA